MINQCGLSALWVGLALLVMLLAIQFKVSAPLSEIVVGTDAQLVFGVMLGTTGPQENTRWI
jgi:hypothetical protein